MLKDESNPSVRGPRKGTRPVVTRNKLRTTVRRHLGHSSLWCMRRRRRAFSRLPHPSDGCSGPRERRKGGRCVLTKQTPAIFVQHLPGWPAALLSVCTAEITGGLSQLVVGERSSPCLTFYVCVCVCVCVCVSYPLTHIETCSVYPPFCPTNTDTDTTLTHNALSIILKQFGSIRVSLCLSFATHTYITHTNHTHTNTFSLSAAADLGKGTFEWKSCFVNNSHSNKASHNRQATNM